MWINKTIAEVQEFKGAYEGYLFHYMDGLSETWALKGEIELAWQKEVEKLRQ